MKFNKSPSIGSKTASHPDRVENEEGGIAFSTDPKTELTLRSLTWLVGEPKFYTPDAPDIAKETSDIEVLIKTVATEDPEYIMKLASYARNVMYLRSAPVFMLVEGSTLEGVKSYVRKWTPSIIKRADQLTETVALFITKHGQIGDKGKGSLPNSLKKGLADSFHRFDRYQLAKYDRDGEVKLKDVLRLVHPKPRDEYESETFKMVRDRTLPTPDTWEVVISGKGSTKENWERILPKMGFMAVLRNLRNLLKVGADIEPAVAMLTDPEEVKRSKQFPFRFYSAYRELDKVEEGDHFDKQRLMSAVETALETSVANLPQLGGRSFISVDHSGSMSSPISQRSTISMKDIGDVMGALAFRLSTASIVSAFGESFATINLRSGDTVLTNVQRIGGVDVGHSTNAWLTLKYLLDNKINVDRIMIFSDMQCYSTYGGNRFGSYSPAEEQDLNSQLVRYKRQINPNVITYSFDLTGYGTVQFPQDEKNVVLLTGWSDRVLEFMDKYENFSGTMMEDIENYDPSFKGIVPAKDEETLF